MARGSKKLKTEGVYPAATMGERLRLKSRRNVGFKSQRITLEVLIRSPLLR